MAAALFILALSLEVSIAAPTGNVTALQTDIAPLWVADPSTRGTSSLLYSCVFTISLCVYTALHLNIPPQGTTSFQNLLRKAKWVVIGVFAPEAVVYAAFVQLRTVWKFRKEMEKVLKDDSEKTAKGVDPPANGMKDRGTNVDVSEAVESRSLPDDNPKSSEVAGNSTKEVPGANNPSEAYPPTHNTISVGNPSTTEGITLANQASSPEIPTSEIPDINGISKPSFDVHSIRITNPQVVRKHFSDQHILFCLHITLQTSKEKAFPDGTVSLTFAWYVIMGGFVLDVSPLHDNYDIMTLTHHAILKLAKRGLFLPVPDENIRDKSKADFLAKGLVFVQVLFLVIQVSARKAEGLPISLLEIHTLVHVVCAVSMYLAWWGKPLDIKDPIRVDAMVWSNPVPEEGLKWQSCVANMLVWCSWLKSWDVDYNPYLRRRAESKNIWDVNDTPVMQFSEARIGKNFKFVVENHKLDCVDWIRFGDGPHMNIKTLTKKNTDPPATFLLHSGQAVAGGLRPLNFIATDASGNSTLPKDIFQFSERAIKRWILAFSSVETESVNFIRKITPNNRFNRQSTNHPMGQYAANERQELPYFESTIPDFFSYSYLYDTWSLFIAWVTCFAYGGIHATAWSFIFPSAQERLLWRISCPLLVALGVPVTELMRYILELQTEGWTETIREVWSDLEDDVRMIDILTLTRFLPHIIPLLSLPFYMAARVFLVTEAFISLRHVPVGVYSAINWALNIPHL